MNALQHKNTGSTGQRFAMRSAPYILAKRLAHFGLLAIFLVLNRAHPQGLELVSKSVVFLEHDFVETFSDGHETFEVWLKRANTNSFLPKMSSVTGSGFLVSQGNHNLYLVTAKHVATSMGFTDNDKIITGLEDGKTVVLPLALLRGTNTNIWLHHERADVSILQLAPLPQVFPFLQKHFIDTSSFLASATNRPSRELALTIVGFPLGKGWGREAGEEFAPLTRKTRASSGFVEGGTLFLLEDPAVQGYSGAPVFDLAEPLTGATFYLPVGRAVTCVGVVSSTISDSTGGKMAGVVPTKCIMELLARCTPN
jgi:hypothetical protein